MKFETRLFLVITAFFALATAIYGLWSRWQEPVGLAALLLVTGLSGMIGFYLGLLGRRIDPRPEDDPYGEIDQGAGDQGVYSPWSWWPLVVAAAAALAFLALAVGWWLLVPAVALAVIALVGWVFEFSRGQHAH
jgi:hypothetical protein